MKKARKDVTVQSPAGLLHKTVFLSNFYKRRVTYSDRSAVCIRSVKSRHRNIIGKNVRIYSAVYLCDIELTDMTDVINEIE